MATLVYLDGKLLPAEQAVVPVFDRGFLYGDSVYEVLRTYGGVPYAMERHLRRLQRSADHIALELPPLDELRGAIAETLRNSGNAESYVRVIVTRGEGSFGLGAHLSRERRLIVIVRPLDTPPAELYERGLTLAVVGVRRNPPRALDPAAKTGNYLNSVLSLTQARAMGADDAVMLDLVGRVTELSTSNVFFVKDRVIVTPALAAGLLEGVTRGVVIELGRARGHHVQEAFFGPEALAAADEVFVTSTLREVMPVCRLVFGSETAPEPRAVGDGKPGPITRALREAFRAQVAAQMEPPAR